MVTVFKNFTVEANTARTVSAQGEGAVFDWEATLRTVPDPFFETSRRMTRDDGNGGGKPPPPPPPPPQGPTLHPFIQGLLNELPDAGKTAGIEWPDSKRKLWLSTAESIFKMIYKDGTSTP
jgi:hypothetical protein